MYWLEIAAIGLIATVVLRMLNVHPKVQYVLLAVAGLGLAGLLGSWLTTVSAWMVDISTTGTGVALGVSLSWATALAIALMWVLVIAPNRFEPAGANARGWLDWTMMAISPFAFPSIVLAWGGLTAAVGV